jgi:DNA-binding MarR family transcriptional regulator
VSHPAEQLDEVVHQRTRLGILAVLVEAGRVQFAFLKSTLSLSDGNLSRHLSILGEAQYVEIEKGYEGKKPRTWIKVTKRGKGAFASEMRLLKSLVQGFEKPGESPESEGRKRDCDSASTAADHRTHP